LGKVCIITSVHSVSDPRIFYKQAQSLKKAGHNVCIIAQNDKNEIIDGIQIIGLGKPKTRLQRMFCLTNQMLKKALTTNADAYHIHDPELLPVLVIIKLLTKKFTVFDIHENIKEDIMTKEYLNSISRIIFAFAYTLIESFFLKFVDVIILAEDSYTKSYTNIKNKYIIRNYPLIKYEKNSRKINAINHNSDLYIISVVGQIAKVRGAFEILNAMKILIDRGFGNIRLNFIGLFETTSLRSELEDYIVKYELHSNIKFTNQIPHPMVAKILEESNLGLAILHPNPNFLESMPTKIFEYYLAGIPVIASNFQAWKRIVVDTDCGLVVDPLNVISISDAIEKMILNREDSLRMGENGKNLIYSTYNWKNEEIALLDIYKRAFKQ